MISGCPNLRSLELRCGINYNVSILDVFAELGDKIRELKLHYYVPEEQGNTQQYLERLLSHFPKLNSLALMCNGELIEHLYHVIGTMPNLRSLSLPNLRSLSFDRNYRDGLHHDPVNLENLINPDLSVLKINRLNCKLPSRGAYPSLISLDLRYTNVTVRYLPYIMRLFPNLKYLKLAMTKALYDQCIGFNLVNKLAHLGEIDLHSYEIEIKFK